VGGLPLVDEQQNQQWVSTTALWQHTHVRALLLPPLHQRDQRHPPPDARAPRIQPTGSCQGSIGRAVVPQPRARLGHPQPRRGAGVGGRSQLKRLRRKGGVSRAQEAVGEAQQGAGWGAGRGLLEGAAVVLLGLEDVAGLRVCLGGVREVQSC